MKRAQSDTVLYACGILEWVPQDQFQFCVTGWLCAGRAYMAVAFVSPSIIFSLVLLFQYDTGKFFWIDFEPEKVTSVITDPLGGYSVNDTHNISQEQRWPALSPQQYFPFELCLVLAQPKLNLSLLNTSLANLLFFGTIWSSQSRQTSLHSSPKAVVPFCFFIFPSKD